MAQKPMLRVEVCARCVARESKTQKRIVWVGKRTAGECMDYSHSAVPKFIG
jgi:hypothetical protein